MNTETREQLLALDHEERFEAATEAWAEYVAPSKPIWRNVLQDRVYWAFRTGRIPYHKQVALCRRFL